MHLDHGQKRRYAYMIETNTFGTEGVTLIEGRQNQAIVLTDLFVSAAENLVEAQIWLWDGDTKFFIWFPEKTTTALNFTGPMVLTAGNNFKIETNTPATDFSVLANYYYL